MRAKLTALAGIIIGFAIFRLGVEAGPWSTSGFAGLMLAGLAFVFSRPS
jgi:hypothetical protein